MSKKVLISNNLYLPNVGGIENSLKYLAYEAKVQGDTYSVVASNIFDGNDNLPAGESTEEGVSVVRYDVGSFRFKPLRFVNHILSALKIMIRFRDYDIKIVRNHLLACILISIKARNIVYLVPEVISYRISLKDELKKGVLHYLKAKTNIVIQRIAFRYCDRIAVFSELVAKQVDTESKVKHIIKVLPGVDVKRFITSERVISNLAEPISLLMVARLVPDKNIDVAIRAMQFLPDNFTLTIVGDGIERHKLELLIEESDMKERVFLVGRQLATEKYYKTADLFLMLSRYEPFGQTILEATASGLPVIGADETCSLTNTKDILGSKGFYMQNIDEYELVKNINLAVSKLIEEPSFRYKLSEFASKEFSWNKLYSDLIANY